MSPTTKTTPIRVLCVDDHGFLIDGLQARLEVESDMEFVGRLATADDLPAHVERTKADVVLLDIDMPGADVFEAIDELRRRRPAARAILFSAYLRDQYLDNAFAAGAWGYLSKSDETDVVMDGIRKVARGETAFSPELKRALTSSKRSSSALVSATPSRTLPATSLVGSSSGSCGRYPTFTPSAAQASPVIPVSIPAMTRSRVDFPAPFKPRTPIFAPGRKLKRMSLRTRFPPG